MTRECWIYGHRMRLIGRTSTGAGVRRCTRCNHQEPEGDYQPTIPGRVTPKGTT